MQKTPNEGMLALVMQMNTIGLSIVYQEFKTAYLFYHRPHYAGKRANWLKNASESLAFIQGTGLEIVMDVYGLMYDANRLRNVFFSMVGDHEKIR